MRETSSRISFWVITVFSKFWTRFRNSWDDSNDFIDTRLKKGPGKGICMCTSVCVSVHVFHKNNFKKFHNSWRIWRWSVESGIQFFFHSCFSKIMLSILFTWRKVKFHVIFDRKNNNNTTYLWRTYLWRHAYSEL